TRIGLLALAVCPGDVEVFIRAEAWCTFNPVARRSVPEVKIAIIFIPAQIANSHRPFIRAFGVQGAPHLRIPIVINAEIPADIPHKKPSGMVLPETGEHQSGSPLV